MSFQTRRSFLQTTSLIAAGAAFGTKAVLARTTDSALPKLGIQLYSLRGYKREEALQHAKDLGFEQVEFYSGMLAINSTDEEIAATKKQLDNLRSRSESVYERRGRESQDF